MAITRRVLLWASQNAWLREHVPDLPLARRAVRRFMPGEDLDAALDAAEGLADDGVSTVLTHLGENVTGVHEAREVARHYEHVLERVETHGCDAEISVKLTHLGLDLDREVAAENLLSLARHADERDNFVWVDMEGSAYTDATLEVVERTLGERPNVGVCLQAYLYRTEEDLERMLEAGAGIRLVKGAYDEPAAIAYPRKSDVDENLVALSKRLLRGPTATRHRVAFATHDERIVGELCAEAERRAVEPEAFEFQFLYGIGRKLGRRLVERGYRLRILISYGEAWYPWYVRRLAERPANLLFLLKQLVPGRS